jgi:hypothetical protein
VKQKRALLKSNPLRDSGMRRRNKDVCTFLGGKNLPENSQETFSFEPPHALKNLGLGQESPGFLVLKCELEKSI